MPRILRVYVSADCPACQKARKMAARLRVRYPTVRIEVIRRESARNWPKEVIATPAYVLDGRLVALGNPTCQQVEELLEETGGATPTQAT